MKRNKRRIDARLKPYLWERIEAIAEKTESTYTEVMEIALEKGLNWYINKIRRELDDKFFTEKLKPKNQENNKPTQPAVEEEEETITDEQVNKILKKFYGQKEQKKELRPVEIEKTKEPKKEEKTQEEPRYNEKGEELW